jgi:dienelactone hydrolase
LALHQHNGQYELGKSEPAGLAGNPEQHYGLELCQRGYVVLCPDHLCFEDRRPDAAQRAANPMIDGPGYERFAFTQRIAEGSCLQTTYIHDMTVALDVLAGLSDVNPERLGAIGHSLGGQEALWLSWYDPRVRAAVSSCGFGQLRTIIRDQINHNLAMYVPGLLALGDLELIIAGVAPRAFMLSAGTEDWIFPIDGVRALAASGRDAYTSAGVAERFDAQIFAGEHRFAADMRERAYAFLDRWLVGART